MKHIINIISGKMYERGRVEDAVLSLAGVEP
jgi:hypothetical protein